MLTPDFRGQRRHRVTTRGSRLVGGGGLALHHAAPFLHVRGAVHRLESTQEDGCLAHGDEPRREERREQLAIVRAAIGSMTKPRDHVQLGAVHHRVHAKVAGNAFPLLGLVGAAALLPQHENTYAHRVIVASAAREENARPRMWITAYFIGTASPEGQEVSPTRCSSISKIRSGARSATIRSPVSRRVPS